MENSAEKKETSDLDGFLERAEQAMPEGQKKDALANPGAPEHRRLRPQVSADRLEAGFDAIFPATTWAEVQDALSQARIVWGIDEKNIRAAMASAKKTGRAGRNVMAARGKPAEYKARQEVHYPFLDGRKMPESGEPVHLASSVFRDIVEVMKYDAIERIRAYAQPVVAVAPGTPLMQVQGKDEIIPGKDVFGQDVTTVMDEGPGALKAGDGVAMLSDGGLVAMRYGFVAVQHRFLCVLSPVWISSDAMEAYFFNPPGLGERPAPSVDVVMGLLDEEGIRFGIDEKAISGMCNDLKRGALRESCVRIARGRAPSLARGQMHFHFDPLLPVQFERIQRLLQSAPPPDVSSCEEAVTAMPAGAVLGEQVAGGEGAGPGRDVFDRPVALPETARKKVYKAGPNVRREVRDGRVFFVSEIYGYAGILDDKVTVLTPMWLAPDRMRAFFVALPQAKPAWPSEKDLRGLLDQARVRFGVKDDVVADFEKHLEGANGRVCLAEGEPAVPGTDGVVELLFKKLPDPGQLLEGGKMDFRERDSVPQVKTGDLLARRALPKPGKSGRDVRGRLIQPPRAHRELLYAGPRVTMEEREGEQVFYAAGVGWARVVKDTLSVQQRFRHRGDVDYTVGNIKMEGDVEIDGSVKSRFRVEASGDVYIAGSVERRAQVVAGGHVVVQRGIVGGEVHAKGNLFARFVQDSELEIEGDLLVRNYIQESQVRAYGKALVQGNEGGVRQLCVLGGMLFGGKSVEVASVGSAYGRPTRVIAGIDVEAGRQIERYQKGLAFCDLQMRRIMRGVGQLDKEGLAARLPSMSASQKQYVLKRLQELQQLRTLRNSLEHHIAAFQKQRGKTAAEARVRVMVSAFPKAAIQIGDRHITIEEETQGLSFRLNAAQDAIVKESLG